MSSLNIISWNVNKYRDVVHTHLKKFLFENNPDVVFLCETRKSSEMLTKKFKEFKNYNFFLNCHEPDKWHGVVLLVRKDHYFQGFPIDMNINLRKDSKSENAAIGRMLFGLLNQKVFLLGVYVPTGGSKKKLNYRINEWDPAFSKVLNKVMEKGPVICFGDFNVAPEKIDISCPSVMKKWKGFSEKESQNFREIVKDDKWIDVYRRRNPKKKQYSWRGKSSKDNYGLRLDNILVTSNLELCVTDCCIMTDVFVSDHVPVGIKLVL